MPLLEDLHKLKQDFTGVSQFPTSAVAFLARPRTPHFTLAKAALIGLLWWRPFYVAAASALITLEVQIFDFQIHKSLVLLEHRPL